MFIFLIFVSYIFCVIKDIKNSFLFYNTLNNVDLRIAGIIPLKPYKNLSFPYKFKSGFHRVGVCMVSLILMIVKKTKKN